MPGSISSYGNWYSIKRGSPLLVLPSFGPLHETHYDKERGLQGKGGKTTISVWEDTRFFLFPPSFIVTWTSSLHLPPNPLIYAPFGQFYSLLVFLQIGIAVLSALHSVSFSFVLSLFFSLSLHLASVLSSSLLLRVPRILDCLLFAYLRVAIRPHFLSFIISLYYSFSRLLLREKKEEKSSRCGWTRFERCWNFVRSPRNDAFIDNFLRENFEQFSRMAKWKCAFFLFFFKINYRISFEWIVRGASIVTTSCSDTRSEYTDFDARHVDVTLPGVIMRLVQTPLRPPIYTVSLHVRNSRITVCACASAWCTNHWD